MKRSGPWPTLTASAGVGHHSVPGFRRGQDLARRRGLRPALRPQARLPRDRPPARHQHNNRMAKVLVLPGLRDVPAAAAGPPAVSRATPEWNQGMPLGGSRRSWFVVARCALGPRGATPTAGTGCRAETTPSGARLCAGCTAGQHPRCGAKLRSSSKWSGGAKV
jgi:hypothetical protein